MVVQSSGSGAKKIRSPGIIALSRTDVVSRYCGRAVRGSATPAEPYAAWTSPEQSYDLGPAAPHTYGFPSSFRAKWTARRAVALATKRPLVVSWRPRRYRLDSAAL